MVSPLKTAAEATAMALSSAVKALPMCAELDLIVETEATYQALNCCADILTLGLSVDDFCHEEHWKEVITSSWKDRQIKDTVREFQEEGENPDCGPFRVLGLKEAIQDVRDGVRDRALQPESES
jgi:hypothetical protein